MPHIDRRSAVLPDVTHMVQQGLVGAGLGALLGKAVVRRMERRRGELSAASVRDLEISWASRMAILFVVVDLARELGS